MLYHRVFLGTASLVVLFVVIDGYTAGTIARLDSALNTTSRQKHTGIAVMRDLKDNASRIGCVHGACHSGMAIGVVKGPGGPGGQFFLVPLTENRLVSSNSPIQ